MTNYLRHSACFEFTLSLDFDPEEAGLASVLCKIRD